MPDSDQQPMDFMVPKSDWEPPSRLPDISSKVDEDPFVALDIETRDDGIGAGLGAGWAYGSGHTIGVSVARSDGLRAYIPMRHPETDNFSVEEVISWLNKSQENGVKFVFHNASYDIGWLQNDGFDTPKEVHDTMILAFVINETERSYSLDNVSKRLGFEGKDESGLNEAASAFGFDAKSEMWKMPAIHVGKYAEMDSVMTIEVFKKLLPELGLQDLKEAYRLECDLIPMAIAMRRRGVRINEEQIDVAKKAVEEERDAIVADISHRSGMNVEMRSLNSNQKMAKLFDHFGIPHSNSFQGKEMENMDHWFPRLAAQARKKNHLANTFIENHIKNFIHNGRIHAEINVTRGDNQGTRTTRLSYSKPPLQQMPSKDEGSKKTVRGMFLPEEGCIWGALDYSQQELRLAVHFASRENIPGVEKAVEMYREDPDTDFHNVVVELTGLTRPYAKDANFAKLYGAGIRTFANMTNKSFEEAKDIMETYDRKLPFFKLLDDRIQNQAGSRGYIRLLDGMRSRFNLWEPCYSKKREHPLPRRQAFGKWNGQRLKRAMLHKALNSLIQGSAARQMKIGMLGIWNEGVVPMIQMHDELDISFRPDEEELARHCAQLMIDAVGLEIPTKVDSEFGPDWGQATMTWKEATS